MRKLFTPIVICFTLSISLFSQSDFRRGFIVNQHNDTILGYIDYQSDYKLCDHCLFLKNRKDNVSYFSPSEIKSYGFVNEKRLFQAHVIQLDGYGVPIFLEVLVSGRLNLYSMIDERLSEYFFMKDEDSPHITYIPFQISFFKLKNDSNLYKLERLVEKRTIQHKDTLKKYMSDQDGFAEKINQLNDPNEKNLTTLFIDYNKSKCKSNNCIKHIKPTFKPAFYIEPQVSYQFYQNIIGLSYPLYGGVYLSYNFNKNNDKLYLKSGITILANNSFLELDATTSPICAKIPLLLEYRFPGTQPLKYFINGGIQFYIPYLIPTFSFSTGFSYDINKKLSITFAPELETFTAFPTYTFQFNLNAGVRLKL